MRRRTKIALAATGATIAVGTAGYLLWRWVSGPKGSLVCPSVPAVTDGLAAGDFIVVNVGAGDLVEATWAQVKSVSSGRVVATLTGERVAAGAKPLTTDVHGFAIGDDVVLDRRCIWDVFRPVGYEGQMLCGPELDTLDSIESPPLRPIQAALTLQPGDRARIVIFNPAMEAPDRDPYEKIWTRIVSLSPAGQVLSALVDEQPKLSLFHGLDKDSFIRFNRDCVFEVE